MAHFICYLFFVLFMKPFLFVFIGMDVRHRERLPSNGALIVTANHNSHLDAWVLMNLFSLSRLWRIRPVAAADYFMKNRFAAWISLKCIGIVPISRTPSLAGLDPLQACCRELKEGQRLIFFPPREHEVIRSRGHSSDPELPISRVAFPRCRWCRCFCTEREEPCLDALCFWCRSTAMYLSANLSCGAVTEINS